MHKTYHKNVRRTISETRGRFLAIFAIVLLGVGFLSGLLSATPDMRASFDSYFDSSRLYDVEILSDLGFTDADVAALRKLDGVEAVQPGYITDALLKKGENEYVARLRSYSQDNALNKPILAAGRLPRSPDECVVINVFFGASESVKLGDTLELSDKESGAADLLQNKEFKVVGFVNDSLNFSSETEYTNIGSGTISLFVLLPEQSFVQEPYTDMFLTVKGARALTALSPDYEDLVNGEASAVKGIAGARCQARYHEVKANANAELSAADEKYKVSVSEANAGLAAAEKKLQDGQSRIRAGEKQLADGKAQLAKKEKELADGETAYAGKKAQADTQLADAERQLAAAQGQIDSGRAAVDRNLADSKTELAEYKLNQSQLEAFGALRALPARYPALMDDFQALQTKNDRISTIDDRLAEIAGELDQAAFATEKQALETEEQQLRNEIAAIEAGAGYGAFSAGVQRLAATGAPSYLPLSDLALKMGAADAAAAKLDTAQKQLDAQRTALTQQGAAAAKALSDARAQLDAGAKALRAARGTLAASERKLNASKTELVHGLSDYAEAKLETEEKLADAAQTLADNRQKIAELKVPAWTVSTRMDSASCASLNSNIEKIDAIARVFPFFFFLVAALVSLTTMTRMVEEDRLQIGTLKALGYSRRAIMGKYISYALTASVLGSIAGFAIGYRLFPAVIWNCYTMMYVLPEFHYLLIWPFALGTSGAVIACILWATAAVCSASLREKPAELMLPKAPDAGKRVFLERITPIWSRMKFTHKVTARNLFRYKKRLWMTVIGVAGCTALLVTAFGLRNSFAEVSAKQYGKIFTYDAQLMLSGEKPLQNEELQALLQDRGRVSGFAAISYQNVTAKNGSRKIDVNTFIPQNCADLDGFVDLHDRASGRPLAFHSGSVVLTEKASEILKLKAGDRFTLEDADGNSGTFTVSGISENYVRNFIFMDAATYEKAMGCELEMNSLTVKLTLNDADARKAFDRAALSSSAVAGVLNAADALRAVDNELDRINTIVVVIIVCAALLAFVVLYNLTNINIEERIKEIATLKVLGFTERETRAYVSRESMILTAIGCAFGLVLGIFLHRYVMGQAEMDIIMFGRRVYPMSFVYSAALTMAFGLIVDFILSGKLRRISMVESMKAPE